MTLKTTAVATELDADLLQRLDAKRAKSERSRAAEVRMAIKAWVEPPNGPTSDRDESRAVA